MEALILLLISICLLSLYGFVYVTFRLVGHSRKEEKNQFRNSFYVLLFFSIVSGISVILLLTS
ncbi:hypothetical protein [Halalkalibacter akibai]|uniref:hypothetical protein n=1 Tax=Halalkalibacter akibai TaxID=1411 RepID=UPI00055319D6|nr:hypothetical protein [Halalkalibacter akibai]